MFYILWFTKWVLRIHDPIKQYYSFTNSNFLFTCWACFKVSDRYFFFVFELPCSSRIDEWINGNGLFWWFYITPINMINIVCSINISNRYILGTKINILWYISNKQHIKKLLNNNFEIFIFENCIGLTLNEKLWFLQYYLLYVLSENPKIL